LDSENLFAAHEVTLCELIVRVWCALRVYKIIHIALYREMVNSTLYTQLFLVSCFRDLTGE
jgi:hypothetical protein